MSDRLVCPDLDRYRELASGRLPVTDKDALLTHLKSCEACARMLETASDRLTLGELLQGARSFFEDKPRVEVVGLVERLSELNPLAAPLVHAEAQTAPPGSVTFLCSGCGKHLKVKQDLAGKPVRCPQCQNVVRVPGPETPACTLATDHGKELSRNDTATLAPSAPLSATDAGSSGARRPAAGADTVALDGLANPELTEFLAPAQAADELGRLGPYRVLAILGSGGMGVVYKAEDPQLKRLVALKAMLPGLGASSSARKRFLREAQSAAAIKHDHIVSVYQVGEERGVPYLAMEFLIGEPLDERLKRESRLPVKEILRIGCEMAEGLSAAHEAGLIHRDIKPANVWLEGKKARVKILDFGLARAAAEEQHLTHSGAIVGTPAFMAPEQAQGKPVDHRCDLFSLGVVLYRLCTGRMAFQGADTVSTLMAVSTHEPIRPVKLNVELPRALSDLVMTLLEKDPEKRVGSAAEVVQILTDVQRQAAQSAGTPARKNMQHADTVAIDDAVPARALAGVASVGPAPRRSKRAVFGVAAVAVAAAFFCALLIGGAVVYQLFFRTSNGTLVVEVEGKDADVRFKDGKLQIYDSDGKKLLYTLAPSEKNKALPIGKYRIKVEGAEGVVLDTDNFEMTQKGWKVRVTVAPNLPVVQKGPDQAPPRAVAETGVLDYAEIHDADEQRFDAWIAQMHKDGLRPVSLSIQVVKDAPRYTGVAVKEEKKRLWEFTRATFATEGDHIGAMWEKNFAVVMRNTYIQDGKLRMADLWLWNLPRTGMWTGDLQFIDNKIAADVADKYRPIHRSASDEGERTRYSIVLGPDDGTPMRDVFNLPLDDCKALIEKQRADGWRPTNLYTYGSDAKLLFGVTLVQEKERLDWDISWSLTPAAYEAALVARKKQGFRPHASVGYDDNAGALRFSVVWIRYRPADSPAPIVPQALQIAEPGVHDYAEIHDADEKRFDAWLAQMKKDGYRPVRMSVQTVQGAPRYTAVALKNDENWPWEYSRRDALAGGHADEHWKRKFKAVAHAFFRDQGKTREAFLWAKAEPLKTAWYWIGDAAFIENHVKNARKEKARLISRCAVFKGDTPEFSVVIEDVDDMAWKESYNLSLNDWKTYVEEHKADGWRPDHFCYYGTGNKRLFGAILVKDPNRSDWDVSWSLTLADYEKELSARKAHGFRPLTAIGHEDNAGGQRFSAIWIRYLVHRP